MIYKLFLWIRFVFANKTGDYDPTTGRYDGAIGMLIDGVADVHLREMEYGVLGEVVDYLNIPYMAEPVSPFQLIEKDTNHKVDQSSLSSLFSFLVPSAEILAVLLAGCLICWIVSWLFARFKRQTRSLPSRRNLQTGIVSFFFVLFLFYIEQFYCNSLSTENVIVPTSNLLYSKEQILKTEKEFCFMEGGSSSELDTLRTVSSPQVFVAGCWNHPPDWESFEVHIN